MSAEEYKQHLVSKIVLNELRIRLHKRFGRYTFKSIAVNIITQAITDEVTFEISLKILGQRNLQQYDVWYEFPKNWWQHFKLQHFPDWLLKKFPVKTKTHKRVVEFEHNALVPRWDQFPKGQEVVMYSTPKSPNVQKKDETSNPL